MYLYKASIATCDANMFQWCLLTHRLLYLVVKVLWRCGQQGWAKYDRCYTALLYDCTHMLSVRGRQPPGLQSDLRGRSVCLFSTYSCTFLRRNSFLLWSDEAIYILQPWCRHPASTYWISDRNIFAGRNFSADRIFQWTIFRRKRFFGVEKIRQICPPKIIFMGIFLYFGGHGFRRKNILAALLSAKILSDNFGGYSWPNDRWQYKRYNFINNNDIFAPV